MQTLPHNYNNIYSHELAQQSFFSRFITWCEGQEPYRLGWMAAIVFLHGCVLTPITVLTVTLSGNFPGFWIAAIAAMGMALVSNLAAMPTKYTIPIFFVSFFIDLVILGCSLYLILQ